MELDTKAYIGQMLDVVIDRPLGSKHPEFDWVYPVNYGYIENIISDDGEELDAYILGVSEACDEFTGECIAIVTREDDVEDKLIIVPEGVEFDDDEIMELIYFQEKYFNVSIVRE